VTTIRKVRVRGGPAMTCQVTDIDTTSNLRTLVGRAAPYGAWTFRGWFQLSLAQGCFDKSIKEAAASLPLLLFHDFESFPIGTASKWDSRADGLWGEWALNDSAEAQRAGRLAQQGVLTGLSVGWSPVLQDWEISDLEEWDFSDIDTLDRCTLREGRLVETSLTPVPAYVDATVSHVAHRERRGRSDTPHLDRWRTWRDSLSS
jgi:HK97 family phage prohead protease